MTISKQLILEKMTISREYLLEAREIFNGMTNQEILQSKTHLHTLERYLQLIVDATLDINNHIIKEFQFEPAKDLKSTFSILADNSILDKNFAQKISDVVGLRNLIVHQYEKVDNDKFLEDFRKHNKDFDEYIKYITSYLTKTDK